MEDFHKVCEDISSPKGKINICVIGAGGTGSYVLQGLAKINLALPELVQGSTGINVDVWDDDVVSESNVVRQLFKESEVGEWKAQCLTNNINRYYGYNWTSVNKQFENKEKDYHLVIICVDSMKSRNDIYTKLKKSTCRYGSFYTVDFGNGKDFGQVLLNRYLGSPKKFKLGFDFPKGYLESKDDENEPSCSIAQALNKQKMFVNPVIANLGLDFIFDLLTEPIIYKKGLYFNLENNQMGTIRI